MRRHTERTEVLLSPDLKERLRAYCDRQGVSEGHAVRTALELLLRVEQSAEQLMNQPGFTQHLRTVVNGGEG